MKKNKMQLNLIKNILECKSFTDEKLLDKEIEHCYAADMMSDVLKSCKIGSLLLTGLVNPQVIQVAEIMDLKGIIFVSGKEPAEDIIKKAGEKNLPLMTTEKQMFDACGILFSKGLSGKEIREKTDNGSRDTLQSDV
jgi:predicted transcriptional regulator